MTLPSMLSGHTAGRRWGELGGQLVAMALHGTPVAGILEHLARIWGATVWHLSPAGEVIHRVPADPSEGHGPQSLDARTLVLADRRPDREPSLVRIEGCHARLATLPGGEVLGSLGVEVVLSSDREAELVEADGLLDVAVAPVSIALSCEERTRPALDQMGTWLVHELQLGVQAPRDLLRSVAERHGIDLDAPLAGAVLTSTTGTPDPRLGRALRWLRRPMVASADHALTLVSGPDAEEGLDRLVEQVERDSPGLELHASVGPVAESLQDLPRSFRQAEVMVLLARQHPTPRRLSRRRLGSTAILLDIPTWQLRQFADKWLGPIAHEPQLLETARAWVECHGNRVRMAARMYLHRNSVTHRVNRLREALELDIDDHRVWSTMWLALEAERVLSARSAAGHS